MLIYLSWYISDFFFFLVIVTIYLMQQPHGGRNCFRSQFEGTQSRDRAAAVVGASQSVLVGVSGRAAVYILADQEAELGCHLEGLPPVTFIHLRFHSLLWQSQQLR